MSLSWKKKNHHYSDSGQKATEMAAEELTEFYYLNLN